MAPSLKNIIKSLLSFNDFKFNTMDQVRTLIARHLSAKFNTVKDWFYQLEENCGVLWLNTSLTFENASVTAKHTKFWRPVIQFIIDTIVKESKHVVFVMMGDHA